MATGPAYNPYGGSDTSKGWLITKYDVFSRPVYTGWYNAAVANSVDRKTLQGSYNFATIFSESKTTITNTINGIPTKYTNNVTPSTFILLTINYYDSYDYPNAPVVPTTLPDSTLPITTNVKGLLTGNWGIVLDVLGSTSNELTHIIYDTKFRPVRSYTKNHLGGYTQVDSKLDWIGKTQYTYTKHKRMSSDTELVIKDSFEYSPQDKLVKHLHKINNLPEQLLAYNIYDELGQLMSKKVGGTDVTATTSFQKVDYAYNIRGWLKSINDIDNLAPTATENDFFAFKINYNTSDTATALYNGNISETFWRSDSDNVKRKYAYQYDHLNRLLEANYSKPGSASTPDNYLEKLSYDKNGNIQTIERNGNMDSDGMTPVNLIDKLDFTYDANNKNLLLKVLDKSLSSYGFNETNDVNTGDSDGISDQTNDYSYDYNGNLLKDDNKGIQSIKYNHLNLPVKIIFVNGNTIEYTYTSVGQKVIKKVTQNSLVNTTDYLNGFQYKNAVLNFFPTNEGYVNVTKVMLIFGGSDYNYDYVFNFVDHLGNVRLSYTKDASTNALKILEENHYYPFGLTHSFYNSDVLIVSRIGSEATTRTLPTTPQQPSTYKYKYNGKELQEELGLNMYDYGARNYDPSIGRFFNVDPMAESHPDFTPYAYVLNNPLRYIDPTGMTEEEGDPGKKGWFGRAVDNVKSYLGFGNNKSKSKITDVQAELISGEIIFNENVSATIQPQGGYVGQGLDEAITAGIQLLGEQFTSDEVSKESSENFQFFTSLAVFIVSKGKNGKAGTEVLEELGTKGASKGSLSGTKEALKEAKAKLGLNATESLPKGQQGKFGSPQRGNSKAGYRLDPAHPNAKPGSGEEFPHINYWDYTKGKRGNGGIEGAIPIKK